MGPCHERILLKGASESAKSNALSGDPTRVSQLALERSALCSQMEKLAFFFLSTKSCPPNHPNLREQLVDFDQELIERRVFLQCMGVLIHVFRVPILPWIKPRIFRRSWRVGFVLGKEIRIYQDINSGCRVKSNAKRTAYCAEKGSEPTLSCTHSFTSVQSFWHWELVHLHTLTHIPVWESWSFLKVWVLLPKWSQFVTRRHWLSRLSSPSRGLWTVKKTRPLLLDIPYLFGVWVETQRVDSPWHNMESPNIGRPEKQSVESLK